MNPYSRIRQQISYIIIAAPRFPAEDGTDTKREFDRLFKVLAEAQGMTQDPQKRGALEQAGREARGALTFYEADNAAEAVKLLRSAEARFKDLNPSRIIPADPPAKPKV